MTKVSIDRHVGRRVTNGDTKVGGSIVERRDEQYVIVWDDGTQGVIDVGAFARANAMENFARLGLTGGDLRAQARDAWQTLENGRKGIPSADSELTDADKEDILARLRKAAPLPKMSPEHEAEILARLQSRGIGLTLGAHPVASDKTPPVAKPMAGNAQPAASDASEFQAGIAKHVYRMLGHKPKVAPKP